MKRQRIKAEGSVKPAIEEAPGWPIVRAWQKKSHMIEEQPAEGLREGPVAVHQIVRSKAGVNPAEREPGYIERDQGRCGCTLHIGYAY